MYSNIIIIALKWNISWTTQSFSFIEVDYMGYSKYMIIEFLKEKFSSTVTRPALLCGKEYWATNK